MATTRIMPLHKTSNKSVAASLKASLDYILNGEKTQDCELVSSYACNPQTCSDEFFSSKLFYAIHTGREIENEKVVSYMIRQSFLPGEITPELANKIGHELASKFTKNKHQFVVATHIDKAHIHNHIIFNSTTLNCTKKFDNSRNTYLKLQSISDKLCQEHDLSIVENPKEKGQSYKEWDSNQKGVSWKAKLKNTIDETLATSVTYHDFLQNMKTLGYEIKEGKHISFKAPEQIKFIRSKTLGEHYTKESLQLRLGKPLLNQSKSSVKKVKPNDKTLKSLIDLSTEKIQKNKGLEHWAKLNNLKQSAKTLNVLNEKGIANYAELSEKVQTTSRTFSETSDKIKQLEIRLSEISEFRKHIANYAKTRDVYSEFKKSRFKDKFYEMHESQLNLHEKSKEFFNQLGFKKLPTTAKLTQEYEVIFSQKKELYTQYKKEKDLVKELHLLQSNVDKILNYSDYSKEKKEHQR